jgi:NAD(P)-dependent dehydrogenase (short-subunit alcohol dehydrogenase family)
MCHLRVSAVEFSTYSLGMDFRGRNIVVTGAASGIGRALARAFHREGANVTIADRNEIGLGHLARELNDARPDSCHAVLADIGSEFGNKTLIESASQKFGFIDLFFANAGVALGTDLASTPETDWHTAFDINVHAHRWAAKHLLPEWLERGEGYFCSTASAAGLLAQIGSAPYSVTKHAAVAFAEWMSITYGDRGVRVSCLCPQGVNTAMLNPGEEVEGIDKRGGDVVRAAGAVLEPEYVADVVLEAIRNEQFLILPHPEVADFERKRTADRQRWLAGMRKLQRMILGQ